MHVCDLKLAVRCLHAEVTLFSNEGHPGCTGDIFGASEGFFFGQSWGDSVDGSLKSGGNAPVEVGSEYPIIDRVSAPSQVVQDFSHQQYVAFGHLWTSSLEFRHETCLLFQLCCNIILEHRNSFTVSFKWKG